MTWQGGFSGVGYATREEFRKFLATQKKPKYDRIVIHNTDAPYITPPVSPGQRVRNISVHYKNMGWSAGPDFFAYPTGVYLGSPMGHSVGCKGWNGNSFHIEAEGQYTPKSKQDPKTNQEAAAAWKTMAWVTAELLTWMGWEVNNNRIKFHKEGNTTHDCPGDLITKPWFLNEVTAAMSGFQAPPFKPTAKVPVKPTPKVPANTKRTVKKGMTAGYVPNLQLLLKHLGLYSGLIDGDFGQLTDAAVKLFQKSKNLKEDGIVGPITWEALAVAVPVATKPIIPPKEVEPDPVPPQAPKDEPKPNERQPLAGLKTSKKGLDMIKHFEGLRLEPYWDNGELAIGYGHANHSKRLPVVVEGMKITEQEAEEILAADLVVYEDRVKKSILVPLFQHEFDALVSLAYNWGPGNLDRSVLRDLINTKRWADAAERIRNTLPSQDKKYYAGIKRRRGKEADMFAGR